jgi:ribose-phosphate pyrophosphokinase
MDTPQIDPTEVRLFCGSSNWKLAQDIANYLKVPLEKTKITRFSNDNLYIQLGASVRSRKVFLLQSLSPPVNDHLMELLMMLDIARAAAAKEIHAIIPYFSFGRSDKKDAPRISITARLVADLLQTAGATHLMTMTLHSAQVHGFFNIPTDPLSARPVFNRYFKNRPLDDTIVIAPDIGHAKSASRFASHLNLPAAAGYKERISDDKVIISGLVGRQVRGYRRAIIYDDEVATGSTVLELSKILVENAIEEICVVCTHGVFTRNALEKLADFPEITEIVTTDTVYFPPEDRHPIMHTLSVANIFGKAIRRNYFRQSIGSLFTYGEEADDDEDDGDEGDV